MELLLLQKLKQAGVVLLVSTDAGTGGMGIVPGFSLHDELQILTENGWTPYEAIAAGTVNASKVVKAMTGRDAFGTIEAGKRADLILVKEKPWKMSPISKSFLGSWRAADGMTGLHCRK